MKIMFQMSICVRNVTFDRFLKIFKKTKNVENCIVSKSSKNHFEPVKKSKYYFFADFLTIFDGVTLSCLIVLVRYDGVTVSAGL